ncbi:MAG: hypothetical protein GTO14_09140 [Anaerolineales bacterium]|nr:hypothetical protein [Anaerolineales bacterium]
MGIFKKISSLFSSAGEHDASAFWVYVRCDHCGEKIRTRVDLQNDLSIRYDEADQGNTYFTRKTLLGSQGCFKPIEVQLTFDHNRQLIEKQIDGGQFITDQEYTND